MARFTTPQNLRPKSTETLGRTGWKQCALPAVTPTPPLRPLRLPSLPQLVRPFSCTPPQAGPFALLAAGDRRDQRQACPPPRLDQCQGPAAAARGGAGQRHRADHPGGWRAVHGRRAQGQDSGSERELPQLVANRAERRRPAAGDRLGGRHRDGVVGEGHRRARGLRHPRAAPRRLRPVVSRRHAAHQRRRAADRERAARAGGARRVEGGQPRPLLDHLHLPPRRHRRPHARDLPHRGRRQEGRLVDVRGRRLP
jgi:hypothetical protein